MEKKLSKEDFTKKGFFQRGFNEENNIFLFVKYYGYNKLIDVVLNTKNNNLLICQVYFSDSSYKMKTLFDGVIKNNLEFKVLLTQLGIE